MDTAPEPPKILRWAYLASLFLLPWSWLPPFPWLHEHAQWGDVVFLATALLWLWWRLGHRDFLRSLLRPARDLDRKLGWMLIGIAGYTLSALVSLLMAPAEGRHLGALLGVAELGALGFITADLCSFSVVRRQVVQVIAGTALLSALSALAGLGLFYAGVDTKLVGPYGGLLASANYARVEGGLYHPNLFANWCVFAVAVASMPGDALSSTQRRITVGVIALASFFAFSRAFLCLLVAMAFLRVKDQRGARWPGVLALFIGLLLFTLSRWDFVFDPTRFWEFEVSPGSRWETWTYSWSTLLAHPIFGIGVGGTPGFYGCPHDAHFTPLQVAATMGVLGAVSFLFVWAVAFISARRAMSYAIFGGLVALALDGLTQDINDFRHIWVLLGLAVSCVNATPSEEAPNDAEAPANQEALDNA